MNPEAEVPGRWIGWCSAACVVVAAVPLILWKSGVEAAGGWFTVITLALFALGIAAFLIGLATAAYRTTQGDDVQVGSMFLLGNRAPKTIRFLLWGAFWGSVLVAALGASDNPFAVTVPMLQLACIGLWAARHAAFPRRKPGTWEARR